MFALDCFLILVLRLFVVICRICAAHHNSRNIHFPNWAVHYLTNAAWLHLHLSLIDFDDEFCIPIDGAQRWLLWLFP
ncbi:hypothetical protein DC094_12005 [Pelagibaculum spongiae]|uniref:Uncharacterized protein n=1 Tax=Pelagibaculum spongiae TaxID=2080658 RepID=A0A2V1GVI8_9GAMM|nr:hypothetical protein DC094_12005 [Pelagibaculum spongiae]